MAPKVPKKTPASAAPQTNWTPAGGGQMIRPGVNPSAGVAAVPTTPTTPSRPVKDFTKAETLPLPVGVNPATVDQDALDRAAFREEQRQTAAPDGWGPSGTTDGPLPLRPRVDPGFGRCRALGHGGGHAGLRRSVRRPSARPPLGGRRLRV
jgi:hypothetical protein